MYLSETILSGKAVDVAERELVILDESTYVADAAKVMRDKRVSSVLVSRVGAKSPVGIVTERDMLYRVIAANKGPFKVTLRDILSSPLLTVDESAPLKYAVVFMRQNHIRRLPVTSKSTGEVIGILTLMSMVGNSAAEGIDLAEVYIPGKSGGGRVVVMCPYCESKFDNKNDLSMHIDRLHLGSGLLEGDLRQW